MEHPHGLMRIRLRRIEAYRVLKHLTRLFDITACILDFDTQSDLFTDASKHILAAWISWFQQAQQIAKNPHGIRRVVQCLQRFRAEAECVSEFVYDQSLTAVLQSS